MIYVKPRLIWALAGISLLASCATPPPRATSITVAAAANLTGVLDEVAAVFRKQTGIEVVLSYGATAQLTQQIENGAPFDVFAAADAEHIGQLVTKGKVADGSPAVYARGQLALWVPEGDKAGVQELKNLVRPSIRFIAIAQPKLAPYGEAAVEALKSTGLWEVLQPKIVYGNDIRMARQYADTGNANAAFTAYSLVLKDRGTVIKVDPKLYRPIEQALGVITDSKQPAAAKRFTAFLLGPEGQGILSEHGYLRPE